jgi:hypothetical protein
MPSASDLDTYMQGYPILFVRIKNNSGGTITFNFGNTAGGRYILLNTTSPSAFGISNNNAFFNLEFFRRIDGVWVMAQ